MNKYAVRLIQYSKNIGERIFPMRKACNLKHAVG